MEISPVGCGRGLKCSVGLCQLLSAVERSFRSPLFCREKKNRWLFALKPGEAEACHQRSHQDHTGSGFCVQQFSLAMCGIDVSNSDSKILLMPEVDIKVIDIRTTFIVSSMLASLTRRLYVTFYLKYENRMILFPACMGFVLPSVSQAQ